MARWRDGGLENRVVREMGRKKGGRRGGGCRDHASRLGGPGRRWPGRRSAPKRNKATAARALVSPAQAFRARKDHTTAGLGCARLRLHTMPADNAESQFRRTLPADNTNSRGLAGQPSAGAGNECNNSFIRRLGRQSPI